MAKTFDFKMYRYVPSLVGCIIAIVVFAILAVLHVWQMLRTKKRFLLWITVGAICEVIGYGTRVVSHFDSESWAGFICQGVFILIGPLFFAATIYMMLGRTIRLASGEQASLISPKWLTRIFVTADINTLIVQGLGASIMGTMKLDLALAGSKIVITGLAMQVATFCAFIVVAADFQLRMRKMERNSTIVPGAENWQKVLWILYSVSSLILARCIFRLVEYAMGNAAYPMAHEWCLYVFDTTLMVFVLMLLLVLNPAKYLPTENSKLVVSDTEALGATLSQEDGKSNVA